MIEVRKTTKKHRLDIDPEGARIIDSGNRRKFESGAVRDICEGKGRCDLMPLSTISDMLFPDDEFMKESLDNFDKFMKDPNYDYMKQNIHNFMKLADWDSYTALLELAKHYEDGAKKYGEHNWEKGIPAHSFIDSAIRHLTKWRMNLTDEPHDRAYIWNIIGLIWTCQNKPELIDFISDNEHISDTDK